MFFSISQITLVYYGKLLKEKGQDAVAHKKSLSIKRCSFLGVYRRYTNSEFVTSCNLKSLR